MKKIAFIGRIFDLKEYCIHHRANPNMFIKICPTDHQPQERLRGVELAGLVVSDWAVHQTATPELVQACLNRVRY